jgi:hypothetical protein
MKSGFIIGAAIGFTAAAALAKHPLMKRAVIHAFK